VAAGSGAELEVARRRDDQAEDAAEAAPLDQSRRYEGRLAGRDVVGSLNLTMTLIEAERMFVSLGRPFGS
jgi:hypothetical protein